MNLKALRRKENLLRCAVAAVLGTSVTAVYVPAVSAQQESAEADQPAADRRGAEEIVVTGSRIVRRDLETNSPLLTVDQELLEDSAFISVEQALNELPQFMVGGAGMSSGAVTSLQGANGLDGGRGSGDMFNMSLLPDNAGMIGIVVPGAANVNLRGLGANRALTLIDGHRAMPVNASMTVDLNTIPSIAIGGMEVITGGASAVYGADALAGVTNIKIRDNFEGITVRMRSGTNEVGDGEEYQLGVLFGSGFSDGRGHAMIGMEYSKREAALWQNRDFFREVMESPYSNSGDYSFGWDPYYSSGGSTGTYNTLQQAWGGNAPSLNAINTIFSDRDCYDGATQLNCVATSTNTPRGGGWYFNPDGTIYTTASQVTAGAVTTYYGPQRFNQPADASAANPFEVACTFTTLGTSADAEFPGEPCSPTVRRVDYGRWLSSPRDAYNLIGRATFDFTDKLQAFASFHFANSNTSTRREPAPFLGGFGVMIPFASSQEDVVYLPSLVTNPAPGQVLGQTRSEYLAGGTRGTNCAPMGGCLMSEAFPVPEELRLLLESRPGDAVIGSTGTNANNPFRGLPACNNYLLAANPGAPGVLTNPVSGANYIVEIDPNTGQPLSKCGPNARWQVNQQLAYLPPRGTINSGQLYQLSFGLRGDLGLSDWTWEFYGSEGRSDTQTNYVGFTSLNTYQRILSAPNYGKGYSETGLSSKFLTCTSGLNPFDPNLVVSQDCIDALQSNQVDRNSMKQQIFELTTQGHVANLPAGEMRGAMGATYRENKYQYTPDSLRERDYITDTSAGQFGAGSIDEAVDVKEVYGELLIPLLRDVKLIDELELELGARHSEYSTGQEVGTYKILGSWSPTPWLRLRGGYNRAERAPNMSELFATPSASAQFSSIPVDPCRNNTTFANSFPGPTEGSTLNNTDTTDPAVRAQLQALCSAQINAWGGNNASEFQVNQNEWDVGGGSALVVGNPDLENERGDTWTLGFAFRSPFERAQLETITGTIDWYRARVTDPIEVQSTGTIINSCFNVNGLNPGFTLDDPKGFCGLIERDPVTGAIVRVYNSFANQGKLEISGVDVSLRWNTASGTLPGTLFVNTNMNFLIDQIQRYGADLVDDYAGFGGAAKFRLNTGITYRWGRGHRVTLTWNHRDATDSPTTFATTVNATGSANPNLDNNPTLAGYDSVDLFNLTAGTTFGPVNASISVNNIFDTKPKPGGYDLRDPRAGFGSFSPFDDLVGRRYSFNLSMDF
jgi:outer membrane receptor protein involved in Fe transport